jgi:hypothetical protein
VLKFKLRMLTFGQHIPVPLMINNTTRSVALLLLVFVESVALSFLDEKDRSTYFPANEVSARGRNKYDLQPT